MTTALLELREVSRRYGSVVALSRVSLCVLAGRVTCLLGDNGAGKSTLIQILSGALQPSSGRYLVEGTPVTFASPRAARRAGIATVYQDLALIPLMSTWRNFFLGAEGEGRWSPFQPMDQRSCRRVTQAEMAKLGVELRDPDQPAASLSGGERQALAIARALHFGARVLVLDEPTAALGVRQTETLLQCIAHARERGVGVVFITHNPDHALRLGDHLVVLRRGEVAGTLAGSEARSEEVTRLMAG